MATSLFIPMQRYIGLISFFAGIVTSTMVDDASTRTTSITQQSATGDLLTDAWNSMSLTIEELWLRETKSAEREIERQMLGLTEESSMSMVVPTSVPLAAPQPVSITMSPVDSSPTSGPTPENCLQGRTSEQYLLDTLSSITTSVDALLNPVTPQGQAFNFLLNDTLIETDEAICNYTTLEQRFGLGTLLYCFIVGMLRLLLKV